MRPGGTRARWVAGVALVTTALGALWCCRQRDSRQAAEELTAISRAGGQGPGSGHEEEVASTASNLRLGTNVAGIGYASFPFVDLMRSAAPFHSGTADAWNDRRSIQRLADGCPARLAEGQIARTFLMGGDDPHFGGDVVVLYEGQGELHYDGGVEAVRRSPGRDVVTIRDRDGLWLEITATDPEDPIRALRVVAPGGRCEGAPVDACRGDHECATRCVPFEESYAQQRYHPMFLAEHAPFDAIRFMNWMGVNRVNGDESQSGSQPIREWASYPTPDTAHWQVVPVDVMVELANATNAAPWFTIPHQATDDFIRRFAERVRERLRPELRVYVEYSNEAWNMMFLQTYEINALGCAAYADDPTADCDEDRDGTLCEDGPWNATQERCMGYGQRWFARRTAEIGAIWDQVFDDDDRVVNVLGMQVGSLADRGEAMLDLQVADLGPVYERVDAVAIAPYFGGGEPPSRIDQAFERVSLPDGLETFAVLVGESPDGGPLQWVLRDVRALREHGRWNHIQLVAYEGGQHFVAVGDRARGQLLTSVNRDPRMGELYDEYLRRWSALTGGSLFMHYASPSAWSEWGYWGSKEYQGQPLEEAPKHQALLRYLAR